MTTSWKQLAEIPESLTRARVLRALGIEVPPEGRARSFQYGGVIVAGMAAVVGLGAAGCRAGGAGTAADGDLSSTAVPLINETHCAAIDLIR